MPSLRGFLATPFYVAVSLCVVVGLFSLFIALLIDDSEFTEPPDPPSLPSGGTRI